PPAGGLPAARDRSGDRRGAARDHQSRPGVTDRVTRDPCRHRPGPRPGRGGGAPAQPPARGRLTVRQPGGGTVMTAPLATPATRSPLTPEEIAAVRKPYRAASLLPGRAYHDAAIHDFERNEWFRRDWIVVGRESDVGSPGTYCLATVDGEPLIVV